MGRFQFKQFSLADDGCGMKVGTDSVLLGAWTRIPESGEVLDVGSGCGILSLMAAQRSYANITGIEIDPLAHQQALANVDSCAWRDRISLFCGDFRDFAFRSDQKFNLIISNPPFFINSLKPPSMDRHRARHNDLLTHQDLIKGSMKLMTKDGVLSVVLPYIEAGSFADLALEQGLFLQRRIRIRAKACKPISRVMMEFGRLEVAVAEESLVIRKNDTLYTEEYIDLTSSFYLNF